MKTGTMGGDAKEVKQTETAAAQLKRGQEAGKDAEQGKKPAEHEPDKSPV